MVFNKFTKVFHILIYLLYYNVITNYNIICNIGNQIKLYYIINIIRINIDTTW